MARPLRIEYAGEIYYAMSRGNARQRIFRDERDHGRFFEGLEATVDKFGFELFGFVCMPTHVHLFFRTPEPNLSRGMQFCSRAMRIGSTLATTVRGTYFKA